MPSTLWDDWNGWLSVNSKEKQIIITLRNVCFVRNIVDANERYLSCTHFKEKYGIHTNIVTYNGCIQAIKSYVCRTGIVIDRDHSNDLAKMHWILYSVHKRARIYYDTMIEDRPNVKYCTKWENKLKNKIEWNCTSRKFQNIHDIQLKWFQINLLHKCFGTNVV